MDCSKAGKLIRSLRLERGMTQKDLADTMGISDRTVSKWERSAGCPDISLLCELSSILGVDIQKILAGDLEPNEMDRGNMKKIKFYRCPDCGNILFSTGEATLSCCGRRLSPLLPQQEDPQHQINVEEIETDLFLTMQHDMSKQHYITFVAYASCDRVMLMKLYPEQSMEIRIPKTGDGQLYVCCNQHGLFKM